MAKAETVAKLIESGLEIFSRHGYDGASLRDIAAAAEMPLSTIHRYFSGKEELYNAVEQHAWMEISSEREKNLEKIFEEPEPTLEMLVRGLVEPVIRRAAGTGHRRSMVDFLRSAVAIHRQLGNEREPRGYRKALDRWLRAFHMVMPELTQSAAVWAYSFTVGAMYSYHVRRQNIWRRSRRRLAECGPRLGLDVRRRACGAASADVRWSVA